MVSSPLRRRSNDVSVLRHITVPSVLLSRPRGRSIVRPLNQSRRMVGHPTIATRGCHGRRCPSPWVKNQLSRSNAKEPRRRRNTSDLRLPALRTARVSTPRHGLTGHRLQVHVVRVYQEDRVSRCQGRPRGMWDPHIITTLALARCIRIRGEGLLGTCASSR